MPLTRERLAQFLHEEMGVAATDLGEDTLLFSSGVLDSFSMVEMLMFIEREAGLRLDPMEVSLDNLDSIGRVMAFLARASGSAHDARA